MAHLAPPPTAWLLFADDVEKYMRGELSGEYMRHTWHNAAEGIGDMMVYFVHYIGDEDIRKKDSAYANLQNTEAMKLISLLRMGGGLKDILKISFLEST